MPTERDALIAALEDAETHLRALAGVRRTYGEVLHPLLRAAYAHPKNHRQETLTAALGLDRVDIAIAARMRALGLGPVLDGALVGVTVNDFSALTANIRALVP